jgi:hypothetical protein
MNILFTSVGDCLTFESEECLREWRLRYHNVEQMRFDHVTAYLRRNPASGLALVDAIVCMADTDMITFSRDTHYPTLDFPLEKALVLAGEVRNLPESCAMRDGRKWRSIPFAIFCGRHEFSTTAWQRSKTHAHVFPTIFSTIALKRIQEIVDEYQDRVLDDYRNLGIMVRFEKDAHRLYRR